MGMRAGTPVWAGVVIQLADGTTWAVEIDCFHDARFSLEREPEEDFEAGFLTGYRHFIPSPDLKVEVHLRGLGRHATTWRPPTPPTRPAIEPAQKAIEGGN